MKKKIIIVFLILGFVLIVLGTTSLVLVNINRKNNEKKKIEETILNDHETFKEKTDKFNKIREKYYNDVVNDLYPELVEENYEKWITVLDEYTSIVDEVETSSNNLKSLCVNKYYSNKDISNKCEAFVIAYETVINYYVKDINAFNDDLEKYRNTVEEEKEGIDNYKLKYNYSDINDDGDFKGLK